MSVIRPTWYHGGDLPLFKGEWVLQKLIKSGGCGFFYKNGGWGAGSVGRKRECILNWYSYTLSIGFIRTDTKFKFIMSLFAPDHYPCSIMWVLEQCR